MQREIKTSLVLDGEKVFKQEMEAASRQLRVLGSEMKANTAAFAGNAESLDALTSRGKIFEKQVAQQKEIVAALSRAVQDSASKYGDADKRTDGYRIKLNNATAALAKMESELEQNSNAIKDFGQDAATAASKTDKLKESAQKMGESLQATGDKISGIGQTMSMSITAPVLALSALATEGTKEFRTELAKLEQNAKTAGVSMETMNTALRDANAITNELDSSGEGLANLLASGFKDNNMQAAMEAVAGAAIKFKDTLKFEGIADGLQETLATGAAIGPFAELLDRSGIALDGFNAGLQAAIANGTQQQYVLDVLAKAGLPAVYEEYVKTNGALLDSTKAQYDLQASLSELGKTIEPILTMVTSKITELLNWFNSFDEGTQKNILTIVGLAAALGPLLVIIGSVIGAVSTIAAALPVLGTAFTVLTGPVGLAIAAVAALVAGGVALYKNWDDVKAKAEEMSTNVSAKFDALKTSITSKIDAAREAVTSGIDRMKKAFDFQWSLPKIKLPHFNISGGFSLNPPRVPSFSVEWYGKGGIFDDPSIIGVGEAGTEVVAPIDRLTDIIRDALGGGGVTIINQGTIVGTNGMKEFADIVSRRLAGQYGLSTGGPF